MTKAERRNKKLEELTSKTCTTVFICAPYYRADAAKIHARAMEIEREYHMPRLVREVPEDEFDADARERG